MFERYKLWEYKNIDFKKKLFQFDERMKSE